MRINHSHFYIGMPQNFFKDKYVSTIHHKIAGVCMAKYMGALTLGQVYTSSFHCTLKSFSAWRE
jgi:hypothetical protein